LPPVGNRKSKRTVKGVWGRREHQKGIGKVEWRREEQKRATQGSK